MNRITDKQMAALHIILAPYVNKDRRCRRYMVSAIVGRKLDSVALMTADEWKKVLLIDGSSQANATAAFRVKPTDGSARLDNVLSTSVSMPPFPGHLQQTWVEYHRPQSLFGAAGSNISYATTCWLWAWRQVFAAHDEEWSLDCSFCIGGRWAPKGDEGHSLRCHCSS